MTKLLLVEDTARLAESLSRGLQEEGFAVEIAGTAAAALARIEGRDMLTARDTMDSRVGALEAGADDYMIKPFAFAELLARMRLAAADSRSPMGAARVRRRAARSHHGRRDRRGENPSALPA